MTRSSGRPSLHAFPTRRSSDLDLLVERLAFAVAAPVGQGLVKLLSQVAQYGVAFELRRAAALDGRLMLFVLALVGKQRYRQRSEEHTSELQSRGQLVCRLLLEK